MELIHINCPILDFNITETIQNGYFWWREKFPRFLTTLQSFLFQSFATNTEKVRIGHFCTISKKFRVFLTFKGLNEKNFGHNL